MTTKIIKPYAVLSSMAMLMLASVSPAFCDTATGVNDVAPVLSQPLLQEPISDFQIGITQGAESPTLRATPGRLTVGQSAGGRAVKSKKFSKPTALASSSANAAWLDLAVKKAAVEAVPTQSVQAISAADSPILHSSRIPGGIVDVQNNIVYVDGPTGGIDAIQLATGRVVFNIKHACMPVAAIDDKVIAFGKRDNSWRLITLDSKNAWRQLSASLPLPVPDGLVLPDTNNSFLKSVILHDSNVQVSWQADLPSPFGYFTLKFFNWGFDNRDHGTFNVNLASGQVSELKILKPDTPLANALQSSPDYQFTVTQPDQQRYNQSISGAGAIIQRRLHVARVSDPTVSWEHDLPTVFVPVTP